MGPDVLKQTLIPIVAIISPVLILGMVAVIIYVVLHYRHKRNQRVLDTVERLAQQGLPVPPGLIEPTARPKEGESAFFRAMSLLGIGVGLGLMFYWMGLTHLMGIGALILCVGVAQLVAIVVEQRSSTPARDAR